VLVDAAQQRLARRKWYSRPPRVSLASAATDSKVTARTPSRLITLTAASRMRSRLLVLIASFYAIGRALAAADAAAQQARDDRRAQRQHAVITSSTIW
jgi:hypothetical protein